MTPCHDIDPNCRQCPLGSNGSPMPAAGGPPSYCCNAFAVSCLNGRVATISLNSTGVVLSQLPPQVNQLAWLQRLGESCLCEA
jgi:hypothetical protein